MAFKLQRNNYTCTFQESSKNTLTSFLATKKKKKSGRRGHDALKKYTSFQARFDAFVTQK